MKKLFLHLSAFASLSFFLSLSFSISISHIHTLILIFYLLMIEGIHVADGDCRKGNLPDGGLQRVEGDDDWTLSPVNHLLKITKNPESRKNLKIEMSFQINTVFGIC
jgi:hypothetical protein